MGAQICIDELVFIMSIRKLPYDPRGPSMIMAVGWCLELALSKINNFLNPGFVLQNFFHFKIFIPYGPKGFADRIVRVLVLRIRIDGFSIFFLKIIPCDPGVCADCILDVLGIGICLNDFS